MLLVKPIVLLVFHLRDKKLKKHITEIELVKISDDLDPHFAIMETDQDLVVKIQ